MILVADSSALIALATCDCLAVLDALYGEVRVPEAVYHEVSKLGKSQSEKLSIYLQNKIIQTNHHQHLFIPVQIGAGEQEAMLLYRQLNAQVLLVDDLRARKMARLNHIAVIGSLGILLKAKDANLIKMIMPLLEVLEKAEIFYSAQLIHLILDAAGETL